MKGKQSLGTDEIRTKVPPSKPKSDIKTNSNNMINRISSPLPQGGHSASLTYLIIILTHKRGKTVQNLTLIQANTENQNRSIYYIKYYLGA